MAIINLIIALKNGKKKTEITPLMQQYFDIKSKHPDALLLFRVGDFYETFGEDAITVSEVLGIVLTSRNNGGSDIELAGFPHHSLDTYMPKLVKAGYRVAICEQLEKPSKEKKIVKRGVTDLVTPGIAYHDTILSHNKNNFLCSIHVSKTDTLGIAFVDISTGEFYLTQGNIHFINKLIQSFEPAEVLVNRAWKEKIEGRVDSGKLYIYPLDEWMYSEDHAIDSLSKQFDGKSFKGYGIDGLLMGQVAAGVIIQYLEQNNQSDLKHISSIQRIQSDEFMWLDRFTIRNLELIQSQHESGKSLFDVMDRTTSPMGARTLKKWLFLPLVSLHHINARLSKVEFFIENDTVQDELKSMLTRIGDLERLASKISTLKVNPRDISVLAQSLKEVPKLLNLFDGHQKHPFDTLLEQLHPCKALVDTIDESLVEEPPTHVNKGYVIKDGYHEALDDLRYTIKNSKQILVELQQKEAAATGIANLKVGFNSVFGYYFEVTNKYKNQDLVPEHWVRKQTLTNSERYISDELKQLETKILNAEEQIHILEQKLFEELVDTCSDYILPIQENARVIAEIDVLSGFATIAQQYDYAKPVVDDSDVINIKAGRHPVIEHQMEVRSQYVPNDIYLDSSSQQIMMITGPNMSGKSAVLRQTALISLMAQVGSFVPAESAQLGYIDKLFTRVGASDNISSGESTFMVEMNETANIMNNLSDRSLVLLDEIGRGTSTYDGISIAWSIAEFLHDHPTCRAKTLFATHYHELNELAAKHDRIRNFNISTKEVDNKVIFLRKLVEGGSEHSFGIHVAQMASMPAKIVQRAAEILIELEKKSINKESSKALKQMAKAPVVQLDMFEPAVHKDIVNQIEEINVDTMTPVDCMMKLMELKSKIESLDN